MATQQVTNRQITSLDFSKVTGTARVEDGSAAAPSYAFASDAGTGFRWISSGVMAFETGNQPTKRILFGNGTLRLGSAVTLAWASGEPVGTAADVILMRESNGVIAQRNGTNGQAIRYYNTYTDSSNWEAFFLGFSGNLGQFNVQAAGTGVQRDFVVYANQVRFGTGTTDRWAIQPSGHMVAFTDNTYDIGLTNANRPRNGHFAGYLAIKDGITAPGAGTGEARLYVDTADGDLKVVFADGVVKTISVDT